jgi:hypothetical protein
MMNDPHYDPECDSDGNHHPHAGGTISNFDLTQRSPGMVMMEDGMGVVTETRFGMVFRSCIWLQ